MKLSVSLPPEDVEFLDQVARELNLPSRSATVQRAVEALRAAQLRTAYQESIAEWELKPDRVGWDRTVGDGLR